MVKEEEQVVLQMLCQHAFVIIGASAFFVVVFTGLKQYLGGGQHGA